MTTETEPAGDFLTVEEYAIKLVADGAMSYAEDDIDEENEIAEGDHRPAVDLALDIVRAIRENPAPVLAMVGRGGNADVLAVLDELGRYHALHDWLVGEIENWKALPVERIQEQLAKVNGQSIRRPVGGDPR